MPDLKLDLKEGKTEWKRKETRNKEEKEEKYALKLETYVFIKGRFLD